MKKLISACLCAFLVLSIFCFSAAADGKKETGTAQIGVSEVTGNPGNEVFVSVDISDNSDITDYVFTLNFEESVLKYNGYLKGVLDDYTLFDHTDEGRLILVSLNSDSNAENGKLITFRFGIKNKAKTGDYAISLSKASFADKDGNKQKAAIKNGSIKVSKPCKEKHKFSKKQTILAATCAEDGTDIRVCKKCGGTEIKSVHAKGHKPEKEFTLDVVAKGSNPGMLSRHCTKCGAKTSIIIYDNDNNAGLSINDMVGKISDDSLNNLIYFLNGNTTYPDITDEDSDAKDLLATVSSAVNNDGSINVASAVDRILRVFFGNDKKGGVLGTIKHAALADEIPVKIIGRFIRFVFGW